MNEEHYEKDCDHCTEHRPFYTGKRTEVCPCTCHNEIVNAPYYTKEEENAWRKELLEVIEHIHDKFYAKPEIKALRSKYL